MRRLRHDSSAVSLRLRAQFLDASAALRDRRRQEEQERQQRELAQAQALAAEQKKRADDQAKARHAEQVNDSDSVSLALVAVRTQRPCAKLEEQVTDFHLPGNSKESSKNAQALAHLAQALRLNPENREAIGFDGCDADSTKLACSINRFNAARCLS